MQSNQPPYGDSSGKESNDDMEDPQPYGNDVGDDEMELVKMDGFDDCILGLVDRFGCDPHIAYDKNKVIDKLIEVWDMTEEEAVEYFEYNQLGSFVGSATPAFVDTTWKEEQ